MIYNTVSVRLVYSRLNAICNFEDDNELNNVYEFIGWAIRDIGAFMTLERVMKQVEVSGHRAAWPCDFFSLNQVCYNGWPLQYSGQTYKYQYLDCEDCFSQNDTKFETNTYVRRNTRLNTVLADYQSTDGIQTVNVNQIVKVASTHTAGGSAGHYYKRTDSDLVSSDLSTINYSGVNWEDVSDDADEMNNGMLAYVDSNPYDYSYHYNPGYIITSFEEGTIDVSYNAIPTDEEGYYKIPDDEEYLNAIEYYVKMRLTQRGWKFPEEPLQLLKEEWKYHRGMARSNAQAMDINQMDVFTKRWMRPLAVLDRAQNFFKPEF